MMEESLRRRIAEFIAHATVARGVNLFAGACIGTHKGAREQNQDRAVVLFADYPALPRKNFIMGVVCDGIGGSSHGEEAAVLSLSKFISCMIQESHLPCQKRLRYAAFAANDFVYRAFRGKSGSTLAAMMISNDAVCGTNAGDSRIYGVTTKGDLKQLSRDDTMADVLGEHGDINFYRNQLVQHIGMGEGIQPQAIWANRHDFIKFLLTTDGIHGISNEAFRDVSQVSSSDENYIHRLLLLNEALGGKDNGTAIALSSNIEASEIKPSWGLNLKFLSPFDHLEIWFPASAARVQRGSRSPESPEIVESDSRHPRKPSPAAEGEMLASEGKAKGKRPRVRSGRSNKKRKLRDEARSPPDEAAPPLEIRFPDDEGG
ncbi:MAG: hypothetical protein OXF33_06905 [Rhodospirillales bacterium]|nr:hypothetical protein [Rhodospirillales bacterium]